MSDLPDLLRSLAAGTCGGPDYADIRAALTMAGGALDMEALRDAIRLLFADEQRKIERAKGLISAYGNEYRALRKKLRNLGNAIPCTCPTPESPDSQRATHCVSCRVRAMLPDDLWPKTRTSDDTLTWRQD